MIANAMSANLFFWIIPGQRAPVKDLREGRPVDPIHGQRAKQRSVHDTCFTLPVLFAMLSNHYSFTHGHALIWVVWMQPPASQATATAAPGTSAPAQAALLIGDVLAVVEQRCFMCHGAQLQMKNMRLDSPTLLKQHAHAVCQQVVVTRVMPMNTTTGITNADRALIQRWRQDRLGTVQAAARFSTRSLRAVAKQLCAASPSRVEPQRISSPQCGQALIRLGLEELGCIGRIDAR